MAAAHALAQAEPKRLDFVQILATRALAKCVALSREVTGDHILLQAPNDPEWVAHVGDIDILHLERQGYRDPKFLERLDRCHLSLVKRYWPRRVQSVALWLVAPSQDQRQHTIGVGDETVRVISVVVPEIPAELLLANPWIACFAPAADPGGLTPKVLCRKTLAALDDADATQTELRLAVIAAMMQGRYDLMTKALKKQEPKPVTLESLVKSSEDRGFKKGLRPLLHQFERKLGRPLTIEEGRRLRDRFDRLGADRVGDVVLDLSSEALAAWLEAPAAV